MTIPDSKNTVTLRLSNTSMWGFRKALVELGAEPGDTVAFLLATGSDAGELWLGDETLADRLVEGRELS
jgi:hypothetical protein